MQVSPISTTLRFCSHSEALTRGNCAMAALCKPQVNKFFQPWVLPLIFLPLTPPLRKPPNRYGQVKKTTQRTDKRDSKGEL